MLIGRLMRSECARVARVLQTYLDGEADPPTEAMVTAHLEFCQRCGLEAGTYRAIKAALGATRPAEVDGAVVQRLRQFAEHLDGPGRT